MDPQDYSAFADWLDKLHTAPPLIQALWLLVVLPALMATLVCLVRAVTGVAVAAVRRPGAWQGRPIYALYQDAQGRWMLYARGTVQELNSEDGPILPPPAPPTQH